MSFTLRSIYVYSFRGDCRAIEFRTSGLNVLTGRAKTGKSSIIDILDYCFGRSECYVAAGVIRRHVAWFGVEIGNKDDILFVGRRNPGVDKNTSPDIYIRRGQYTGPPDYNKLQRNTTEDALVRLLSRFAGIAENEHRPLTGTRRPLQATIRHALFLCFQKQDEIASRDRLFHRQGEQFIPQAIKDTIPYFLGAVDEGHFLRQNELDDAKLKLRRLEAQREAMERTTDDFRQRIRHFLVDARRVGLIDDGLGSADVDLAIQELRKVVSMDIQSPVLVTGASETIGRLESELGVLRGELEEVKDDVRVTRHFIREQTSFSAEVNEQRARLVSLELYSEASGDDHVCPLCETRLDTPISRVLDLREALSTIKEQLRAVGVENPHLQERLDKLAKRRSGIEEAVVATQRSLERAYPDDERARRQRDEVIERARVVGRIGAFLEQTTLSDEKGDLERLIAEARQRVDALEEGISADDIEERVYTFLNLIADEMTTHAIDLDLEHAEGGRIRLDLKKLSVVAETVMGPISLSRIGSGENWVGYHVVTLLALHSWFRKQHCPVPGILILDQPSQAHYPPEADRNGSIDGLQDADRRAVHGLFKFMHVASQKIGEHFQLIVLDHAHLDDEWFEECIVEEWRDDKTLVPDDWTRTL